MKSKRDWFAATCRAVLLLTAGALMAMTAPAQTPPAAQAEAESELTSEQQALRAKFEQYIELEGKGRYAEALVVAEEIVAMTKESGDQDAYATALNNLSSLCVDLGDYARALPLNLEALEMYKQLYTEEHPTYARCLNNLAGLYQAMGEYGRAESLFRQSLEIRRRTLGENDISCAAALNNLGLLYSEMGDYARAEPLYREALEIAKAAYGEHHANYAISINNLAQLYRQMGDFERADPLYRQAIVIHQETLGDKHPYIAVELCNLGDMYREMWHFTRAEPLFEKALEINNEVLGAEHPNTAETLGHLALLYYSTTQFGRAEPLYEEVLKIQKKALGERHPNVATTLNQLALVYRSTGDFARAEPLLRQAIEIKSAVLGEQHPDVAIYLHNLGDLYFAQRDYVQAAPYFRSALDIVVSRSESTSIVQDEAGQHRQRRDVESFLHSYLSCQLHLPDGAKGAYGDLLNWKGATLVRQRAARAAGNDPELAPVVAELQMVVRQWSALAAGGPNAKERLARLAKDKERLEARLMEESAPFRAAAKKVEIGEVEQALPKDAALVDYFEFSLREPSEANVGEFDRRHSLVAFVVRPGQGVQMFDLGDISPINEAIDLWRRDYGKSAEGAKAGQLLREKLWTPLAAAVGDARLVLVAPDGELGKLPFAALPGANPNSYLIEGVSLALVPVPQLIPTLVAAEDDAQASRELLLLGGVDYDRRDAAGPGTPPIGDLLVAAAARGEVQRTTTGLRWGALPGTTHETGVISELFRSVGELSNEAVEELTGPAATEEQFRALAPTSRILHVATHGFFAPEAERSEQEEAQREKDPILVVDGMEVAVAKRPGEHSPGLLSGLVLAGANAPPELPEDSAAFASLPEDGILTADELAFLPLTHVQLVVLSACETGLGEVAGGEGLLGIQRAFQVGGARTTVATLWKVDDDRTAQLMTAFYRNILERKQPYLDALRNAQLEILRELRAHAVGEDQNDELRGADAPAGAPAITRGDAYYWAAFTLSGDWR